ncbi:hypothetical protein PYV61_20610, partial [Roseisolibacter sp. H3M3-2]
ADAPAASQAPPAATANPPVEGPPLAALRERLARGLDEAARPEVGYDAHRLLLLALEAALRGGPFDRACFCALDVAAGTFRARFGLGDGVEALLARLALPAAGQGPGATLARGDEAFLSTGTRLQMADAQLLRAWGAASVALVPVSVAGTTIGAVYVDRRATSAGLDATALVYLRRVVGAGGGARARLRAPAPPPVAEPTPEAKGALVLRLLRGESPAAVAAESGVPVERLERWREEFLAGAVARLGGT